MYGCVCVFPKGVGRATKRLVDKTVATSRFTATSSKSFRFKVADNRYHRVKIKIILVDVDEDNDDDNTLQFSKAPTKNTWLKMSF